MNQDILSPEQIEKFKQEIIHGPKKACDGYEGCKNDISCVIGYKAKAYCRECHISIGE